MNSTSSAAVIFAGPSLPPAVRPANPAIEWRPPVKQGEMYQAALTRPAIIGIIDGYFEVTPTVWHKEILWAMAHRIHVYGSASIGALRAAELCSFGMIGVGRICAAYRDGILTDDDEVAVMHGPEELGYPAVTEAMVNIRATLEQAVAEGIVEGSLASRLTEIGAVLQGAQLGGDLPARRRRRSPAATACRPCGLVASPAGRSKADRCAGDGRGDPRPSRSRGHAADGFLSVPGHRISQSCRAASHGVRGSTILTPRSQRMLRAKMGGLVRTISCRFPVISRLSRFFPVSGGRKIRGFPHRR
jgi:hypothetical protein